MIFKPMLAAKVLAGEKTQTRRRLNPPEHYVPGDLVDYSPRVPRYVPGRDYAVQDKRGGKALGRIRITDAHLSLLDCINGEDGRAEGFEGRNYFKYYWYRLYGEYRGDEIVWVYTFELVSRASPEDVTNLKEYR